MKWTIENRRAYLSIKTVQILLSLSLLATIIVCHTKWMLTIPNKHVMVSFRLLLSMLVLDLFTFTLDVLMVIKRWKSMSMLRFIVCCISFTLGIVYQINFSGLIKDESGLFEFDVNSNVNKLMAVSIVYIYVGYISWMIINMFMYF